MNGTDLLMLVAGLLLTLLDYIADLFIFVWEHRVGVVILVLLFQLGAILSYARATAEHLWRIQQILESELIRRNRGDYDEG